jgi:hypothetical protein
MGCSGTTNRILLVQMFSKNVRAASYSRRKEGDIKQLPYRGPIDIGRPGFVHPWTSLRIEFNKRTTQYYEWELRVMRDEEVPVFCKQSCRTVRIVT